MAKNNLQDEVTNTVRILKKLLDSDPTKDMYLMVYKSRLFDESRVDKGRRNQFLQSVNKEMAVPVSMKEVREADDSLLKLYLNTGTGDELPDIPQLETDLPELTAEFMQANAEEFVEEPAAINPIEETPSNPIIEGNETMKATNATNSYNSTTSTSAPADVIEGEFEKLHTDPLPPKEEKAEHQFKEGQEAPKEPEQSVADESFMDKLNAVNPAYLAAAGAVVGAGAAMWSADRITLGDGVGAAIGIGASYFGADMFLGGRENTLMTKAMALSGGLVLGGVCTKLGHMGLDAWQQTNLPENKDALVTETAIITPVPNAGAFEVPVMVTPVTTEAALF